VMRDSWTPLLLNILSRYESPSFFTSFDPTTSYTRELTPARNQFFRDWKLESGLASSLIF
jgi:hypothetical protein